MKRVLRKLLSTLLALVMVLSLMPMSALAYGQNDHDRPYASGAPSQKEAAEALKNATVWVYCTKDRSHSGKSYSITGDSLEVGTPFYQNDWYYCRVTVKPDSYVDQYKKVNGDHTLSTTDTKTLTLYYSKWDRKWHTFDNSYVTFHVTCSNGGGGGSGSGPTLYPVYVYARIYDTAGNPINPGSSATLHGVGAVQAALNKDGWITIGMADNATTMNPTQYKDYCRRDNGQLQKDLKTDHKDLYDAIVTAGTSTKLVYYNKTIGLNVGQVSDWEVVTASGASDYVPNGTTTTWHLDGKITAYTVTYNANEGAGTNVVDGYYLSDATATVKAGSIFTAPTGKVFDK